MPNHVTNNIYLKGDSDRIRELLEAIKNDEYGTGSIDFNKIIPMPESLDITSGSETVRCHKIYKDFLDVYTLMDTREGLDLMSIPIEAEERYLEERTDVAKEDFELGKQVFQNMQLYGAPTWYEWRIDNWGTKWNAYGYNDVLDASEYFSCETAWSAPHPVLDKLSQMYPDIEFTHEWADEDIGNNCGRRILQNGECIESYYPRSSKEAIEFATEVQGYTDPIEYGLVLNASETDYISVWNREYEGVKICGVNALFTNEKLTLEDIPKDTHCYYLRSRDDGIGFGALELQASVNVGGTIISGEPIAIPEQGYIELTDKNYPDFTGEIYSIEQYMADDFGMKIKEIDVNELRSYNGKEGLILKGCGGKLSEWLNGINELFKDEGILLDDTRFKAEDCIQFKFDDYTCMMFTFNEDTKLNMGQLAMWRLKTLERFGGEWLTDFVDNKLGGFEKEHVVQKPKCPLIGQDGNIYNLMGIASKTLRDNKMLDQAVEMKTRITTEATDYSHALRIIGEYVEITSIDDEDMDEDFDEEYDEDLDEDYETGMEMTDV